MTLTRRVISSNFASRLIRTIVIAGALALTACQQDLYSNLSETEANQMLATLLANGITVEKTAKGKEGFTLAVESRDMLRAIAVLNDAGFPKSATESIGKIFQKSGIMSSPFEERVRYIYALSEEVARTLSQIDGVVTARVHIVLPDSPQLGQPVKPSSAAVFIKHQPGVDLDFFVPQIRRLVSSSIEGLEYTAVTVVLADAAPTKMAVNASNETVEVLPGISIKEASKVRFWRIVWGISIVLLLLIITNIATLVAALQGRLGRRRLTEPVASTAEPS